MESCELSIGVGDLIGVPKVTLRGTMDGWHDQVLTGVLKAFQEEGTSSLVLDMAGLAFAGVDGATSLINALRSLGPQMCIHLIAAGSPANILRRAELGPCIRLYSTTDEIAEYLSPVDDSLTSRWLAAQSDDNETPLAA